MWFDSSNKSGTSWIWSFDFFLPFWQAFGLPVTSPLIVGCMHDQELLNFTIALIKATKFLELKKESHVVDGKSSGLKDLTRSLQKATEYGVKKAVGTGIPNTNWITKMVG